MVLDEKTIEALVEECARAVLDRFYAEHGGKEPTVELGADVFLTGIRSGLMMGLMLNIPEDNDECE